VAYAYFSGDLINIVTVRNGVVLVCTVDPRSGSDPNSGANTGYLDYSTSATVKEGPDVKYFELSETMQQFYGDDAEDITVAYRGGDLDGYELGASLGPSGTVEISKSSTPEEVVYGCTYVYTFEPSRPIMYEDDE